MYGRVSWLMGCILWEDRGRHDAIVEVALDQDVRNFLLLAGLLSCQATHNLSKERTLLVQR